MKKLNILILFSLLIAISCSFKRTQEKTPIMLKISGPMKNSDEEISGMDWYNDNLIILPENLNGYAFAIKKTDLDLQINSSDTSAIKPKKNKFQYSKL